MKSQLFFATQLLVVLSIAVPTFATEPLCQDLTSMSCVKQIKSLFDEGTLPVPTASGDYAGRCSISPESGGLVGKGALLRVVNKSTSSSESYDLAVAVPEFEGSALNYFDDGTQATKGGGWIVTVPATQEPINKALVIPAVGMGGNVGAYILPPQEILVKRNGDYLLGLIVFTEDDPSHGIHRGGIGGFCQFFKKVN